MEEVRASGLAVELRNVNQFLSRGVNSTTAAAHADGATVELYQAHKVPFTEINKTFTVMANMEIDSYTLLLSTTPVVDGAGSLSSIGGTG